MKQQITVNAGCAIRQKNIKHNVVGRTTLASSEYTNRHNKVAGNLSKPVDFHL